MWSPPTPRCSSRSTGSVAVRAIAERVQRAKDAGAVGLIVTTDWSFSHGRDWGSPTIPERVDLRTIARMAPEVITKPSWLWSFGPQSATPRPAGPQSGSARVSRARRSLRAYGEWMGTPPPTWDDIAWLRELWGGAVHAQGRDGASTTPDAPVGRRCVGDLGIQSRRQQSRWHPGSGAGTAGDRRRGSATKSRCCSTEASGGAATSSKRWRWAREPS